MPIAYTIHEEPTDDYLAWLNTLEHDVIEEEFGYEPGEFSVQAGAWWYLYEEGLSPRAAWQRALDAHCEARLKAADVQRNNDGVKQ